MSSSDVVLYRYDGSLFSDKVHRVLHLKSVPHQIVQVSSILPRPEITDLLGLKYRRIPILAIDNDIYCDTSLIISALERRFPPSQGYGSIFPSRKHAGTADTGLIKAFAKHYADTALFSLAPAHLPWDRIPKVFIDDRSSLRGGPINIDAIIGSRNQSLSTLSAQLALVDEQLKDGREWLFDTVTPSLADVAVHFVYNWLQTMASARPLFNEEKFPHALNWLSRLTNKLETIKESSDSPRRLKGEEAAQSIASAKFESYDIIGFDEQEAQRLGLKKGDMVAVDVDDNAKGYSTIGKLVLLNNEEYGIEVKGKAGLFRCHFPRIGITVRAVQATAGKL